MKKTILSLLFIFASTMANAGVVVIGNSQGIESISVDELKRLFLGKGQKLSNGNDAKLFELPEGSTIRTEFHEKTTKRNDAQLRSNWSRLVFTGKATAPVIMKNDVEMINAVKASQNAVGYIDESALTNDVKVLMKF